MDNQVGHHDAISNRRHRACVLGVGAGNTTEKYDLVGSQSSQLLVDDIYCTGTDATADDVYAAGWVTRSVCTAH